MLRKALAWFLKAVAQDEGPKFVTVPGAVGLMPAQRGSRGSVCSGVHQNSELGFKP